MSAPLVAQRHERTSTARDHLPALDGVRGVAILAVVAFHVAVVLTSGASWAYRDAPPAFAWPAFAGSLGVDLFFVLSGFLVLRSWRSIRKRYADDGVRSIVEFARRRGRRILPPYWVALAILVVWRAPQWIETAHGWRNLGLFVSLNQFLDTDLPRQLNTVTWSLTTETHFYVLLPFLAAMWIRFGWRSALAVIVAVSVAWRVLAGGTGDGAEWIFGRVDQFAAGMAAAALFAEHQAGRTSRALRWLTARGIGAVLSACLVALALAHGALRLQPKPLSFLVLLPVRLALYGGDTFRASGADEGTGETALLVAQLAFAAWSLALLVLGVRVVHGWSWLRSLAAIGAGAALLAAVVGLFAML